MLKNNDTIYCQLHPDSKSRLMYAARVSKMVSNVCLARFVEESTNALVAPPQESLIYFKKEGKFLRQAAILDSFVETSREKLIKIELQGQATPAENRQCYRASTVLAGLEATVDDGDPYGILDVSATGLSVKGKVALKLEQLVRVTLEYDNRLFAGEAYVKNSMKLEKGFHRYGLSVVYDRNHPSSLCVCLNTMCIAIQREQLRRLAGQSR